MRGPPIKKNHMLLPEAYPETLADIQHTLDQSLALPEELAAGVSEERFHHRPGGKWSIGENLEHLVLSNKGVASALGRPKGFFAQFGPPDRPSRSFQEMHDRYFVRVKGRVSPPPYAPRPEAPKSREEVLESWRMIRQKYAERLAANWTETDLDTLVIPHPVIGKLTMREMLFFHIFHNHHHYDAMRRAIQG